MRIPDLNVVVSSGDQMIAGAYKAEKLAGKAKIANIGNGCTFEAKQLILAGKEMACSVYLPITEGRLVVQALVNAVNGADEDRRLRQREQVQPDRESRHEGEHRQVHASVPFIEADSAFRVVGACGTETAVPHAPPSESRRIW